MRDEDLLPLLDEQLARLSQADRTALLLRYYERRSLRDVGDVLGISEEAAKKRLQRAVEKLRTRMAGKQMPLGAEARTAILADKLVQPAPAKLSAAILAHAAHGTTATVMSASQSKFAAHVSFKALASGKTALTAAGAVLATALVAAGITVALAKHNHPKAAQKLIISRATTYITRPLDKDGLPNYKLALQQYLMKGVTPENNAAVPAIEIAMQGFHGRCESYRWVSYKNLGAYQLTLLGVAGPRIAAPQIHSIHLFFKAHAPQGFALAGWRQLPYMLYSSKPKWQVAETMERTFARDLPWRTSQCLMLWTAIDRNKAAMRLLQGAARLPHFYLPEVYDPTRFKSPELYNEPLVDVVCSLGNDLACNATLQLGRGHVMACWRDVTAIDRLAWLAGQTIDGSGAGPGNFLWVRSLYSDRVLLGYLAGHPQRTIRIWSLLNSLPVQHLISPKYLRLYRLGVLQQLLASYRRVYDSTAYQAAGGEVGGRTGIDPWQAVHRPPSGLNWNWQFRKINATYDHWDQEISAPAYSKPGRNLIKWLRIRAQAMLEINKWINPSPSPKGRRHKHLGYAPGPFERLTAKKLGVNAVYHNELVLTMGINFSDVLVSYQIPRSQGLISTGFALAAYHAIHHVYPKNLKVLCPKYLSKPPVDWLTGRPLVYTPEPNGYDLSLDGRGLSGYILHGVEFGPTRITIPPPAPTGWQKGPFP